MSGKLQQAVEKFRRAQDARYEQQRYTTIAEVTAVTTDTSGRVTSVVARIDGSTGQTVQVGYGSPLGVGSLIAVQNHGEKTHPTWRQADIMQGVPAGYVAMLIGPGGQPYVGPQGVVSPAASWLRNGDFSQQHRDHLNQAVGWVSNSQTQLVGALGER